MLEDIDFVFCINCESDTANWIEACEICQKTICDECMEVVEDDEYGQVYTCRECYLKSI